MSRLGDLIVDLGPFTWDQHQSQAMPDITGDIGDDDLNGLRDELIELRRIAASTQRATDTASQDDAPVSNPYLSSLRRAVQLRDRCRAAAVAASHRLDVPMSPVQANVAFDAMLDLIRGS